MTDDYQRAITEWLKRTGDAARMLGSQYESMGDFVRATGGATGDASGIRGTSVHPAAPIRVEVIDLQKEIRDMARKYADLTRGTLRMGISDKDATTDTRGRLRFISGALVRMHAADPDLAVEIADAIWSYHRRAGSVIERPRETLRPFRIDEVCPSCGFPSLWVNPKEWMIGCGMPACRSIWGVDQPVLRLTV